MPIRISSILFFSTILFRLISSTNLTCLQFDFNEISCSESNSTDVLEQNERSHLCLNCQVYSLPDPSMNYSNKFSHCQNQYRCVFFNFVNFDSFTRFFNDFHEQVAMIFNTSIIDRRTNSLAIRIQQDDIDELFLSHLYSIVHFNETFYPDFYLILNQNRSNISINLDQDLPNISLRGLSIEINCQQSGLVQLMFLKDFNVTNSSEKCVFVYRDPNRIRFTSTRSSIWSNSSLFNTTSSRNSVKKSFITKKRWIFFLIGSLLLIIWLTCFAYLFYIRSRRWRSRSNPDIRLSFVSSAFTNDSVESRHELTGPIETKTEDEQSSARGFYSFGQDF